ncbi:MAG: cation:proton antiporter [Candidatus Omnitrophica bacterium]|nr:cation:proton antiporter [Candidatus Omnitrophota bacterium]
MHAGTTLIQDLAIVMMVSAIIMVLCRHFKLPLVLGYIITGAIIGPNTPPFPLIKDLDNIYTLSELGIIFLLFSIGLEFSFKKLFKVGAVSLFAAAFEILLMIWFGFTLGRSFGWGPMDSIFLGAILSISSTTIIAKILLDLKIVNEKFAQVSLGILIVEDLIAIVIIALLSGAAITGHFTWAQGALATLKVIAFVIGLVFIGFLTVPRTLKYLSQTGNSEMLLIAVLGMCFGSSLLAAQFGFSVALGAFLIGAIIAETPQSHDVVKHMEPIRDMFTAVFFVSVGMLIEPAVIWEYRMAILIITLVTIAGKVASRSFAVFLMGYEPSTSFKVGLGLAQIGEFSFIIASLGQTTHVTSHYLYPIAVAVSAITTLTTPLLMHNSDAIVQGVKRFIPRHLVTFSNFYTSWVEQIRETRLQDEKKSRMLAMLKEDSIRLAFYAIAGCAVMVLTINLGPHFQAKHPLLYWTSAALLALPVLIGAAYTLDHALWHTLFLNIIPPRKSEQFQETQQALHRTFRFLVIFFTGLSFIALGTIFYKNFPWVAALAGLFMISGLLLWDAARGIHARLEQTILSVFDQDKPLEPEERGSVHDKLVQLISDKYPWEVETQDFLLPYQECGVNQTIHDLRLRGETGVSIVSIYRASGALPNPAPSTVLQPGDVLLLIGNNEQLKSAVAYLQRKIKEPPLKK